MGDVVHRREPGFATSTADGPAGSPPAWRRRTCAGGSPGPCGPARRAGARNNVRAPRVLCRDTRGGARATLRRAAGAGPGRGPPRRPALRCRIRPWRSRPGRRGRPASRPARPPACRTRIRRVVSSLAERAAWPKALTTVSAWTGSSACRPVSAVRPRRLRKTSEPKRRNASQTVCGPRPSRKAWAISSGASGGLAARSARRSVALCAGSSRPCSHPAGKPRARSRLRSKAAVSRPTRLAMTRDRSAGSA